MASICRLILIIASLACAFCLARLGLLFPLIAVPILAGLAWRKLRRGGQGGWSHGTARIAEFKDISRAGLLAERGPILGRLVADPPARLAAVLGLLSPLSSDMACRQFLAAFFSARWWNSRILRPSNYVHLLTIAPAGAGKGVSVVIPTLLSHRESIIATDVKGELYTITAAHRRSRLGQRVIKIDPFGVCGPASESATLNPLDAIDDTAEDFLDQCRDLANQLVVRTGKETETHWNDAAEMVIAAFVAFVCSYAADRSERTLSSVRKIVSSRASYAQAVAVMQQLDICQGVIRRLGNLLSWFVDRELGSVLVTVQRHTQFLDSPSVARNIERLSFDPRILRSGKATVYLILPHDKLASLAPLQRMWIGSLLRTTTRGRPDERNPILWLLDEMGHLRRIQALEDAVTLMRGMGVRLWMFFQSRDQMSKCFGDHAVTVLDNAGTQQYFGISNSYDTAEAISKRIGDATITVASKNTTTSRSRPVGGFSPNGNQPGSFTTSTSTTYSDTSRRLIKPEEIMVLPEDVAMVFHKNTPVVFARLLKYYDAPEFARGGTGSPKRLGFLAVGPLAVIGMVATVLFAAVAASLPSPGTLQPAAVLFPQTWEADRRYGAPPNTPAFRGNRADLRPYGNTGRGRTVPPSRRRRSGDSGFLIEIK